MLTDNTTQRPLRRTWIETYKINKVMINNGGHNVLFGGRGLKLNILKRLYQFMIKTQRPLRRTWIETVSLASFAVCGAGHNVLFGGRGLKR